LDLGKKKDRSWLARSNERA